MRTLPRRAFLPLLLLLLSLHANAQPAPQPPDAIEEIVSTGERTPASLRAEIRTLERDMFALFNQLNSTDEFDVTCDFRTPTGSKIPLWSCDAAFMRDAEGAEFMQMKDTRAPGAAGLTGLGYLPRTRDDVEFMLREKAEQMQEELRALAFENPELASAVMALHARRLQLAEMEQAADE